MARRPSPAKQLDLFQAATLAQPPQVVAAVPVPADVVALSHQLPRHLYLGTSSWTFSGWRGLVFAADAPENQLARHGLAAYAQHPLLRAVGIDRTYYAPISTTDFAAYAAVVPDNFRFLVKAHELCTLASFRATGRYAHRRGEYNACFLDAAYATEHVVQPYVEGLGEKAGVLLWQFPPQNVQEMGGAMGFAERLGTFLQALPHGPLYAVELRNSALLTPAYGTALTAAGAVHCFNVHPRMPPVEEQQRLLASVPGAALVVRWMIHPTQRYDSAKARYQPFNRIVDDDPQRRYHIACMCLEAVATDRPAFVIVNNKAEGSAPLTVAKLAEYIVHAQRTTP
jgi:uncharacterized protein YecE (DUF72 family)